VFAVSALVVLALFGGQARADIEGGRDKLVHGDYEGARKDLAKIRGAQRNEAQLLVAEIELRTGDYDAAERRAKVLARTRNKAARTDARAKLAEVLLATGRYADARTQLEQVVADDPDHMHARYLLATTYQTTGALDKARAVWEMYFTEFETGKIQIEKPRHAYYFAQASRYTSSFEDANQAFREAVVADPTFFEANLAWGDLFLEKYSAGLAAQSFDDVLKLDSKHPDAHAGMALVKMESYEVAFVREHIAQALAVNPRHARSLRVRALLEIDANEWDAAKATLAEVFAVNPNDLEAHALLATIHWLRDDMKGYDKHKNKAFAVNPKYAELYHIVARSAEREHRYKEAIELEEAAVELDPTYYLAMQSIGSGYLRLGQDEKGLEWLRKAWEGDEYNVRTYNLLDLFEEVIAKDYEFSTSKRFKIRYHKQERPLLSRYVEPLLDKAYAGMVKRYGFHPVRPTTIELYRDPDHYAVRTVGLPNLGALGVCFGRVITAMSPSGGNINWSMVLWHELGHVFAIQKSNSRVPRWYTEGLSEYETIIARPEWRRENDVDVWAALEAGTLPSVAELNHGFLKPSLEEVVVAYHTSSVTIEYIAKTYGFDKIVDGLELYGKGLETPEVIEKITGLTVVQFDAKFRKYLRKRLSHYAGTFRLPSFGFDDLEVLEQAVAAAPKDAMAHARLGLGYFYAGDADKSGDAMNDAIRLDSANPYAMYVLGELALRRRDTAAAKQRYVDLIAAGHDGYEPRIRLGYIAIQDDDVPEAENQLALAKKLDPERSDPYVLLADMYETKQRKADALAEYEKYVMIEQMQYGPVKQLVTEYAVQNNWKKVRKYGELAVNINPNDGEMLLDLGRAYFETRAATRSLYTYDSALIAEPKLRRPALAHVGRARAYKALGKTSEARAAVAKALKLEPKNKQARQIQNALGKSKPKSRKRGR
jgi:tetratricopeptide (TPR) repeat protein